MEEEMRNEANQYLTFRLGEETFALEIGKVREVLDFTTVTRVPGMPPFVRGAINLRGSVVPVVDMHLKLGLAQEAHTRSGCIIIVEVGLDGGSLVLGALADSVQEVLELEPGQIEAPPHMGSRFRNGLIRGMGKQGEQFLMILDIDEVFSDTAAAAAMGEPLNEAI